jgi:hypothetical protein
LTRVGSQRSRARRVWRVAWIGGLGMAVIVVIAALAGILAFQSRWGQERLLRFIVAEMQAEVNGTVVIEEMDTGLLGRATARGIEIRDGDGNTVIRIASAEMKINVVEMARGKLHINEVVIDGMALYVSVGEDGSNNLSELFDVGHVGYSNDGPVIIDSFVIQGGHVEVMDMGQRGERRKKLATIVDLELEGSGYITEFNTSLALRRGHARWREGEIDIDLSGDFYTDSYMLLARQVKVGSRDSRVFVRSISNDFASGRSEAAGHVYLASADILVVCERARESMEIAARICDELAGNRMPDISVTAALSHESGEFPWFARAWIEGQGEGVELGLDASLYIGTVWPSLYGSASGAMTVDSFAPTGGRTTASLEAYAVGDRLVANVQADAPRGGGRAWMRAHIEDEIVWFDELGVRARIPDLAPLSDDMITGRASSVEIDIEGPWNAFDTRVAVKLDDVGVALSSGDRVRIGEAQAGITASKVSLAALPEQGRVSLTSANIRYQDLRLSELDVRAQFSDHGGRASATITAGRARSTEMARDSDLADLLERAHIDLTLTRRKDRTRVNLGRYRFVTGAIDWRGRGGTIIAHSNGGLSVSDIVLNSSAGQLSAQGALNMPGRDQLVLGMTRLDLAQISALLGANVRGTVTGTWRLRQGRSHWLVEGDADVRRVAWTADAPPLSGAIRVELQDDLLLARVQASAARNQGRVSVEVEALPPADPFDMAAWQRIRLDRVRKVEVVARGVKFNTLRRLLEHPSELPVTGELGGALAFRSTADALTMDVHARNVALRRQNNRRGMTGTLGFQMTGTWNRKGLNGHAELSHEAQRLAFADYQFDAGIAALWSQVQAGSYAALQKTGLRADIRLDDVKLRRLQRAGLIARQFAPLAPSLAPDPLCGTLSGSIQVHGSPEQPRATIPGITIRDLRAKGFAIETLTLTGTLKEQQVSARISATQPGGGALRAAATYGWAQAPELDAEVSATGFDLATLRLLATSDTDVLATIDGTMDARLRARGTPERPRITGTATIEKGELWLAGGRHLHDARGSVTFQPGEILIRGISAKIDEGNVRASGAIGLGDDYQPRTFRLRVESQDVAVFSPEYIAKISLVANINGTYRDETIDTRIQIAKNARVMVDESDRSLQSTDPLADLIYVDERARKERARTASEDSAIPTARITITAPSGIHIISKEFNTIIRPRPSIQMVIENGELVAINGSLNAVSGQVVLFDQRYKVDYATLQFENQPTNPSVNAQLSSEFPSAMVFIQVAGTVEEPAITLSSNPSKDETTILAIMLGQEPDTAQEALTASAVSAGTLLASRMRSRLPVRVDVVRTHHDGITIGRWITGNLLLAYRYRTAPDNRQNANEATIHWRFDPAWLLEGHYGDNDIGGIDLLWNHRF